MPTVSGGDVTCVSVCTFRLRLFLFCLDVVTYLWGGGGGDVMFKGLTNETRDGLKVVAFDRSPFKLFTLRFSNKSVQAPSSERPKTTRRTLFLSFEINNCLQITA